MSDFKDKKTKKNKSKILEFKTKSLKEQKIEFFIISHKTKKPIKGPAYDMHKAAKSWLYKNKFFDPEGLNFIYKENKLQQK